MSFMRTFVPCVVGWKTFTDHTGSLMSPAAGGVTEGSGRRSRAGNPRAAAAASPTMVKVTVLENAALRDTLNVGPSYGAVVVDGRVISDGGTIAKSGICITVPS